MPPQWFGLGAGFGGEDGWLRPTVIGSFFFSWIGFPSKKKTKKFKKVKDLFFCKETEGL